MTIYLYIKTHKITGLKYLGKTIKNPHKYYGSGTDWVAHLNKYGYEHYTDILMECKSKEELGIWGRYYSRYYNIVTAQDDYGNRIWANRIPETGAGGGAIVGRKRGEEFSKKCSFRQTGKAHLGYGTKWWNNGITEVKTKNKPEGDEWVHGRFGIRSKINTTKAANNTHPAGSKNGRYDHRIHTFINLITNEIVVSTQYDFRISRNMCRRSVNRLVDGSLSKYKGWILKKL
jgi:hypothetical protein